MEEKVYINGALVPRREAKISVADHGFLYGYGLFQTMRAYHGKIFLLDRHVQRLREAAEVIGVGEKVGGLDLEKACNDTLKANKLKDARVRLTVTNGDNLALPWVEAGGPPTVVVNARPFTPFPAEKYSEGFKVGIASVRRMKQSIISSMKSVNYLVNVMARMEASARGLDEALLLNEEGYIAEGGSSNVFFIREGRLVTPSPESGLIPGVTREAVIGMAGSLGIAVSEGTVGIGAIKKSDEMFMTNAIIEVMPVTEVRDDRGGVAVIGKGKPGEITRRLMSAYREMVEKETGVD
jgi:branched-chain amino acid aminotransferase